MNSQFKERFKSKLSVIGKLGIIESKLENKIRTPEPYKLHKSFLHPTHRNLKVKKYSLGQIDQKREPNPSLPKIFSYKPYTLKDYKRIKPNVYYELGGLGAFNIGSPD